MTAIPISWPPSSVLPPPGRGLPSYGQPRTGLMTRLCDLLQWVSYPLLSVRALGNLQTAWKVSRDVSMGGRGFRLCA